MDQQPLNVESIIQRLLEVRGSRPGKNVQLTESEIRGLCLKSREILLSQPILLDLEAPMKVVGDIHGQYYDLMRLFEYGGFPPESNYLFLGNYVDFGRQSLETICLLLAYKIKYPENFYLLRGNHECAGVNREYGFYDECKRRYNIRLWKTFTDCFNCLPVVAIMDEKIFCCHGGLSPDLQSMEQIRRIMRPIDVPDQGLLCDLMWADRDKETLGWGENDSGVSFTFGTEIVSKFLTKHDLDLICRGNQMVEDGYEFFAKRQLVTLFSAPNFKGEYDNAGAIMSIDETLMCSFQIIKPQDKKGSLRELPKPISIPHAGVAGPMEKDDDDEFCMFPSLMLGSSVVLKRMRDAHTTGTTVQKLQNRDSELDGRKEYQSIVEQNMQAGGNGVHMYGRGGDTAFNYRRVRFKEDEALVAEFDDTNLWAHDPNETPEDMIKIYKKECIAMRVRPVAKLLEQLERLNDLSTPIDTLDLRGVRLDNKSCEVLETVLSRLKMSTLDLERTNLDDEGAIALCEMVEFYGCASKINLSYNNKLRARAWLAIGRTLRKSSFITTLSVGYCGHEEQTLTLLLRPVRTNCALQCLRAEGNSLAGKGTFILMAAMKCNTNLRELYLANNQLSPEDGQYLGGILRTNHTLQVLDLRDNNLQDDGVRFICAGIAEQQEGLCILNLANNNILQDGLFHISSMFPSTKTLRELNISHNRSGDEGMYHLKLGLLANQSLEKLLMCDVKITCGGAMALAEVVAEHKHLLYLDLKENDIRVAGLMALERAHRMNLTLLTLDIPRNPRVDIRDRTLIKNMYTEIENYCKRNHTLREKRILAERHEQHISEPKEADPAKDVVPSLVGSLGHVYEKESPGVVREDPFQNTIINDKEKPTSLLEMEKTLDAMVSYGEGADVRVELRGVQDSSTAKPDVLDPKNFSPITKQEQAAFKEPHTASKPNCEDQKGEQALHVQLEAKLNLMAAQLSEAQQKLHEEQKLSGHLRSECDRHLKDLGHTREELDGVRNELGGVRKELDGVRKELVDLKKEHTTCKTSWIAPRHDVILLQKSLGGGAWGYVVEGQFRGQQVAVKCIHEAIITEQHVIKRVYREICTMAQMSHPNLVLFIAAVLDDQGGPMIITELLDTTLRKAYKDSLLNLGQCIDLFRDVASALSYLHELEAPIIHRDVSTTNVLMKGVARDKWIAKLSDFGSANWARQACTMGEGAIVYTAPEAFPTHPSLDVEPQPQTTKIDVYSYGILVCEVTLREFPDPGHLREMKEKMKTKHVLLHTLVIKCTHLMPDKRPTMAAVLNELDTIRMKL